MKKPMNRPKKEERIVAPYLTFIREALNPTYPIAIPRAMPTRVRRTLMALAGFIELINRLDMMKKLINIRIALTPADKFLNSFGPKKLEARPIKIIKRARSTGTFLSRLRSPCMLKTGHPES
jgi:hypothetical protein